MPSPVKGDCNNVTTSTFAAAGTANGPTKMQALDRARVQAETLLDSYVASRSACPAECPTVSIEAEPDYDSKPPAYSSDPQTPMVFVCTVEVSRVVIITCSADTPTLITITPSSIDFGDQATGKTSAGTSVTITNGGTQNLTLTSVEIVGPFAQSGLKLPATVAPGGSLVFSVTFTPPATGAASGSLTLDSNDPAGNSITLAGNGI